MSEEQTNVEVVIEAEVLQETPVTPEPKKEPTQEEIMVDIYKDFEYNYKRAKQLKNSMSLNSMLRVFDAVLSFPFDETAISRVKKNTPEFELFIVSLGVIKARTYLNAMVERDKQVKEELNKRLETETKEHESGRTEEKLS